MKNTKQKISGTLDQGRPALLRLVQNGCVTTADVAHLRRNVFSERPPTRLELEDLFAIDAIARPNQEAWIEFFVDTVTDHIVWDIRPTGVVDEAHARWLISKVDASQTVAGFAVLINVLDQAHRVPRWFAAAVRARAAAGWPSLGEAMPALEHAPAEVVL